MEQLLIVEDDLTLNQGLCKALKDDDRQIVSCVNIAEARLQLSLGTVTFVLLDINLPDGSGLVLLREIKKEKPSLPVVLLTANDTDRDIVNGLEEGADDYITKPFSLAVLRARVNSQLRRASKLTGGEAGKKAACFTDGKYSFNFRDMLFYVDGLSVELSKTEQKLLCLLTQNAPNTVPRELLIDRIWTDGAEYVDENALSVTVKRLRDKLSSGDKIRTVYGIGYAWCLGEAK
ncbi:MAG: response regulator transcription factor [Treponemataceae bacterium]|nr:response regulator transcription factor [Treponemataceae bacterium]